MANIVSELIDAFLEELDLVTPRLQQAAKDYAEWLRDNFPLGWLKVTRDPVYFIAVMERTRDFLSDIFDIVSNFLTLLPARIAFEVILSNITLDRKLRQRVMTLDQVALFPVRVMLEDGIRQIAQNPIPPEFAIQQRLDKLRKIVSAGKAGRLDKIFKALAGSIWARVLTLVLIIVKWAEIFGVLVCLYHYVKSIESRLAMNLTFNAKLSNKNPRQREVVSIRRRVGGVKP